jgi:hypothetical protein
VKAEPPLYNQSCKWRRSLLCEHDRFVVESRCQEIEYLKFDSYRHQTDDFRRLRRLPFNVKSMKHTQSASRVRSRRNKWRTRCSLILSEAFNFRKRHPRKVASVQTRTALPFMPLAVRKTFSCSCFCVQACAMRLVLAGYTQVDCHSMLQQRPSSRMHPELLLATRHLNLNSQSTTHGNGTETYRCGRSTVR